MLKRIRIAILVYVLLFVAVGSYLSSTRSTDWNDPLWVDVYLVNGDDRRSTQRYIDTLDESEFRAVETFFAREAERHGVALDRPFRLDLAGPFEGELPQLPRERSLIDAVLFSLAARFTATRLNWASDRPTPDIVLFAVYHDPEAAVVMESSAALRKGLIAMANLFADARSAGPNQVVMAHELLHTLGASDKYDPATNLPVFPHGFAEPGLSPRFPQRRAELMGGRIPVGTERAEIPPNLDRVVVGPATAAEIGWLETLAAAAGQSPGGPL